MGRKSVESHEQRQRTFAAVFESVPADRAGTAMGASDAARDAALSGVTFDQLPDHPDDYSVPEPPPSAGVQLVEAASDRREAQVSEPLRLDDRRQRFYDLFDHVTESKAAEYGGQAFAPDAAIKFEMLPDRPPDDGLPEVSAAARRDVQQGQRLVEASGGERVMVRQNGGKMSERYERAHDAFVRTFSGELTAKE